MFHTRRLVTPHMEVITLSNGSKFQVDLSDTLQREIYYSGEYEPAVTKLINKLLQPGDVCVDIGANVGYHTVLFSSLVGNTGHVHSFEPLPDLFQSLQSNVDLNCMTNVTCNQTAVYQDTRPIVIYLPATGNCGSGAQFKRKHHSGDSVRCQAVDLDHYVNDLKVKDIDLIKLDIEGTELLALKGMKNILSRSVPPHVICEVIPELMLDADYTSEELFQFLASLGYSGHFIDKYNVHFTPSK